MAKVIIVIMGAEPQVDDINNPLEHTKSDLLLGSYAEVLNLPDGVVVYHDEGHVRHLRFNRAIIAPAPIPPEGAIVIDMTDGKGAKPGEIGEHRIRGNFLLTRHGKGRCIDLTEEDIGKYLPMLRLELAAGRCKRCGGELAYPGALFCGAGCSARYEAGD